MASPAIDYDALAKQYGAVSSTPAATPAAATAPAAVDYDALAQQHGAISSTGTTPQVESSIRYLTTEDYQPPPPEPGAVARFGKQYTQQTGINDLLDIIRASNRYGAPQEVAARGEKAKTALGHLVTGLRDEPARIGSELAGVWQSMLDPKQDTADMSMHMLGAIPMLGPGIQGFVHDVWAKKYPEAAADLAAIATLTKGPKMIEAAGEALPAVAEAAKTAATATAGGLKGGLTAAVKRPPYGAALIGQALGGPKGAAIAAGLAKAPSVIRSTIQGARTALADTAAAEAAAAQAARTAAMENVPPAVTELSPDYFDRLRLPPGPAITPPPPDTSYVRGVPGQYATPEPLPPSRQLPAGPNTLVTPLPEDTSFVRAVPAQYPEVEPGFRPPVAPTPAAPALSFDDLARSLTGKSPSRLTVAERANVQSAYDRITKGLQPEDVPPVAPAAPQAAPAAPEVPAATQEPPAPPIVPEAPQTLQQAAEGLPPETANMTPEEAEQVFQAQKAAIEGTMTPPEETPPPAAPPAGGVVLQPLPADIPPHYGRIQATDSTMAAMRAFNKDLRISDYLLGKGITPEEFEGMTLEQQNALIREAPAASKKGKHLPFLPKPEGAATKAVGRWAEEGIKDIADTMRWRQAQKPAAPLGEAAIPTEGIETPAQAKAAFETQQAAYEPKMVIHGMSGYDSNLWDMVQSGDASGFGTGNVQKTYTPELRTDTTSAATRAAYERLLESRKQRLLPQTIKARQQAFEQLLEKDKQAFMEGRPPDETLPPASLSEMMQPKPAPTKRTRRAKPKS